MKNFALLLSLISFSAYSNVVVEIPANDIAAAARNLTKAVEASGKIECASMASGVLPTTFICVIDIDGNSEVVDNSEKIIRIVQKVIEPSGSLYQFAASFEIKKFGDVLRAFIVFE